MTIANLSAYMMQGYRFDDAFQTYERLVKFSLQTSQLEKLERLQDPRDLDNVLMEIFEKSTSIPNAYGQCHDLNNATTGFLELIVDIFRDVWQLTQTSEIRFLLIVAIVIFFGWALNKRYRIGFVALLGGGLFMFGYMHTYLECNRELEVNEMLEILDRNKQSSTDDTQSGFLKYLKVFLPFSNSQSSDQRDALRKSTKISLGFCRPDHVLIMYFNDIFLKYLEVLLEQCTKTLTTLRENLSFPSYIVASFFLISIIGFVIKLTFQYILSPAIWSNVKQNKSNIRQHAQNAALTEGSANTPADHISGENLKLLLNAINAAPLRQIPMSTVSGVEEIQECIEAPPTKAKKNLNVAGDKQTTSVSQNNNNKAKEPFEKVILNVKLEDAPDE
ncbi:uncharacterized protein LOC133325326 [Musca vetustissima]|uniref:uncharacterized protein LOC133325326 n=1 Tax=Musca vetustissima TaxID=27455 RepID=UPI002AB6A527|nr:uncharacterized protein LOC133325326 [Musca vetustissima]